jgi:hypothetical protein
MKQMARLGMLLCLCGMAASVQAAVPASLYDIGNCVRFDTPPLDYVFCDDGVPAAGGSTANVGGLRAITVPAEYGDDGYTGLPPKKIPTTVSGADTDGNIALDVDITWPLSPPPAEGYPLLFFMHGCCSGNKFSWESGNPNHPTVAERGPPRFDVESEKWHYNNAWFASRGYVVVNYTSRGFATNGPTGPNRAGSTGQTQIDSRRFEINDFQHLACQVLANASQWDAINGRTNRINPNAVVATGGSYGGGFAWMALTDPIWNCNAETGADGQRMKLAAVAPRYGWTDLVYSLVPTGRHSSLPTALPSTDGCDSSGRKVDGSACETPLPTGMPKQSINAGLYGTGLSGANFPASITEAQSCLSGSYPSESNPACNNTLATILPEFLADRSAYYQQHWFNRIVSDPEYRIPVFNAATFTDPLFPPHENRRMHNRILALLPDYPLKAYFGDYQHFVQNKTKEWADICGENRRVCTDADFSRPAPPPEEGTVFDFNAPPVSLVRTGVTTRLNRFIDHYAKPAANPAQAAPSFDVTAALQVCPGKGTETQPVDEPGDTFTAARFESLANATRTFDSGGSAPSFTSGPTGTTTTSTAGGGTHADPVATSQMSNKCSVRAASDPAPTGVVQYTSAVLEDDLTLLGAGVITALFTASGDSNSVQLNARLYEVLPNNSALMADRGFRRLSAAEVTGGVIRFELFGNGWKFTKGSRIRLELMQDDAPYLKSSTPPSSLSLQRVVLNLPVRTTSSGTGDGGTGGGTSPVRGGSAAAITPWLLGGLLLGALLRRRWRRSARAAPL